MTELAIGDNAPEIILPRDGGSMVSLSDFAGKKVVLYFYPKDDTPGCTKEAIDFTQLAAHFIANNTVILGLSNDSLKKHDKFVAKHKLGIALLSDEKVEICKKYGTWQEKSMYGKSYMGIERTTFLISVDGIISHIWRKVKVPGHVDVVLTAASEANVK